MSTPAPAACLADHTRDLVLPGLDGPVRIVRDRWGVPHVRAESLHDAFFAQGFCLGQDRAWQLELQRHMAHGRAAALLNKGLLGLDIQNRTLGFARLAETEWQAQTPEARLVLQAYADGVNAAIATQPRPWEFHVLDHEMAPWSPVDSLAVIKMVSSAQTWAQKLKFGQVAARLGPEAMTAMVASLPPQSTVIVPSGARWTGELHPFAKDIARAMGTPDGPVGSGGGSNCWVVAPSKSASGAPLVAGDPHLPLTVPGQWYLMHIDCPEFTVAGAVNPSYPGPVFYGHNTHVAWTMTHAQGDRWDLYRERIRIMEGLPQALNRGLWEPLNRADERFDVRGGDPVAHTRWVTRHGPVIFGDPLRDGEVIAARWGLEAPAHDMDAMLGMLRATSAADARAALRDYDSVSGNYCFADTAGHIGYQYVGRVPKRDPWLVPVPGWDGEHEWAGDVPKEELPSEMDPANGFIVTANNRTTGPGYPHYLAFSGTRFRADRLRELLDGRASITVADCIAMQSDVTSIHARELAARFAAIAIGQGDHGSMLRAMFNGWDGTLDAGSATALAFDHVCEQLVALTLERYLGPAGPFPEFTLIEERRILYDQLMEGSALMLPDGHTWEILIAEALATVKEALVSQYGPDTARWRFDAERHAVWRHNLGRSPEYAALLNLPDVPVGGDPFTPNNATPAQGAAAVHGVSYRQIIDLADPNGMLVCIPPGNSGQPGSGHYGDELERWRAVEYHPLHINWSDIEANVEAEQLLRPV